MAMTGLAWIIAGVGIVGLVLLVWGWRGRRVGEHIHCRGCEFDLFGSGPTAAACPECGAGPAGPRATAGGVRRRRKGAAGVGLVMTSVAVLLVVGQWSKRVVYAYAPSALLVWVGEDPAARDVLDARRQQGQLSGWEAKRLIAHALD